MSLIKKLKQPFPYESSLRYHIGVACFFGIFIFLFILLFKPFGLAEYPNKKLVFISLGYGLVTFLSIIVFNRLFPFLFPKYFNEQCWTTGKQILLILTIIFIVGLGNYFISPLLVDSELDINNLIWFQGITIMVAALPVGIYFLIRQNQLLKKFSKEAGDIDEKLADRLKKNDHEVDVIDTPTKKIVLTGTNQGEQLDLYPDDIHVISAASNYIRVFHMQKEKLEYSIIRSTLKKAEEAVLKHPNFFKCHRAHIINLDKVIHVEGNAQGYKIRMDNYADVIPVSRNLNEEFADKLFSFRQIIL
jgi:DNA-binding LytR/AlgR family response regulator